MSDPFSPGKPPNELSLVEIAEQLEKVTSWIEAQRVKEREARAVYQAVAQQVEAAERQIRQYAQQLVDAQDRKISSFSGMLNNGNGGGQSAPRRGRPPKDRRSGQSGSGSGGAGGSDEGGKSKMNIAEAIQNIWTLDRYHESLTTEEIGEALPDTGYRSNAAPTSLKSSINQALAKLCRSGQVIRFRSDGTRISARDNKSRARKYIAANLAGEE